MKYISVLFLVLLNLSSLAQVNESSYKNDREKTFRQILDLKENGAIVFRAILTKKNVELYRAAGKNKVADRIEKKLNKRNRIIATALLDKTFDFCPTYVIESKDYYRVLNGEQSGYFLNENLKIDSTIIFNKKSVYFLEVSDVYETLRTSNIDNSTTNSSSPISQHALVVKDRNLKQLNRPFPYFISLTKTDIVTVVTGLNTDIEGYEKMMTDKYQLQKKDMFLLSKIFYLNDKFRRFYFKGLTYKSNGGFEKKKVIKNYIYNEND